MKNYRFYAEMPAARGSKSASKQYGAFTRRRLEYCALRGEHVNCIAVPLEKGQPMWQGSTLNMDAFGGVTDRMNSPVEGISSSRDYLRKRCVRIGADLAATLHPRPAAYLK